MELTHAIIFHSDRSSLADARVCYGQVKKLRWDDDDSIVKHKLATMAVRDSNRAKAEVLAALYGRLNLNLVRANATDLAHPGCMDSCKCPHKVIAINLVGFERQDMRCQGSED
ncbi:hypothetical protein EMCRGX_G009588 [Ephydatia muelleri]